MRVLGRRAAAYSAGMARVIIVISCLFDGGARGPRYSSYGGGLGARI